MAQNTIKKEIFIDAPVQKVWDYVSVPAWWVGEKGPDHVTIDGNRVVATCKYGRFPVVIETTNAPSSIVCRWASSYPGEEPKAGNSTVVEFGLESENGGTRLKVTESGFAHLDAPESDQIRFFEENSEGWSIMMNVIKDRAQ
ncbi:MAG: polyketide cyclase [Sporolactobacillus laevolacticus]|jgi:uncharacterized protein YndB with AHSA1/START domain|nr:polyketide cyclase [Sporolactobacillus laevolacticus]